MAARNLELVPEPSEDNYLMSQIDQILERDGGIVEAYVPIDLIDQEEVAVDQEHVVELAESIKQESSRGGGTRGQLTPVLLGQVPGRDKFVIIDGFHRVPAVKLAGNEIVYATVKTNCSVEDVIDLRIVAAKSHKKVKFSRIVEWVEEAWEETPWSGNVDVSSAFVMTFLGKYSKNAGTGRGRNGNGLTKEDVVEIQEWVRTKCTQWDVGAVRVGQYLRTARTADPELVKAARERTSGSKLEVVTPMHLSHIARNLPHDYTLQNVVAEAAVRHTLTVANTQALSLAISKAPDYQTVDKYINTRIWERMINARESLASKRYKDIDPNRPDHYVATLVEKFFDDQVILVETMIENAILKGTFVPNEETANANLTTLVITSDAQPEEFPELPEGQEVRWSQQKVQRVAERVLELTPFLSGVIKNQFPFNEEDAEDIISTATIRFLDRVNDGRLPEEYGEKTHLRRLLTKFVVWAAIDEIRKSRGREGQKPLEVSMYEELGEEGLTLEDVLGVVDERPSETEGFEDTEFVKNLLPFLGERQRRVLIMKANFGLTYEEIAAIVGSTPGSVAQCFKDVKTKAWKLSEEAQIAVMEMTA
jgi:RNA polymerase sigma factor (sigma-70 family)